MRFAALTPAHRLAAAMIVALVMAGGVIWAASGQPWLGLKLTWDEAAGGARVVEARGPGAAIPPGAAIVSISGGGQAMALEAIDFTVEPDGMALFADYDQLMQRQDALAAIQRADSLTLEAADGAQWSLTPDAQRPLGRLPADFWVQLAVGVFAWLIASCIWAFRPNTATALYLLLSGLATLVFSPFAGVYTTRELALPEPLFRTISDLNFLGGSMFMAAVVALLLHYPRRIAPNWVGVSIVGVFVLWWIAQQMGAFESVAVARRVLVLTGLLATFVLAGVQWWGARRDPAARAALQWFLMSWLVGTMVFALAILMPQLFGVDTGPYQGYAFLLFLLVYGGLAFGVMRFRLFELGVWWMRMVIWAITVLVLVALDLVFVLVLQLSGATSLSLALLICALIWLPLRAFMWSRFFREPGTGDRAVFEHVVAVGFAGKEEQAERWRDVLQLLFEPLHMAEAQSAPPRPALAEDGLALLVPGIGGLPAMRLEYARRGRRLFTRIDEARAAEAGEMLRHVVESRRAYEQGVAEERQRIASDIHDNVGARLLSALHSGGDEAKNSRIRETLTDLRVIVNDAAGRPARLEEALSDLRAETAERLDAHGVALDWPLGGGAPDAILSADAAHALRSIVREAVSNALKHAAPSRIAVTVERDGDAALIAVEDDGPGFDPQAAAKGGGNGLVNMRRRAESLGGAADWSRGPAGGARMTLRLPASGRKLAAE